MTNNEPLILKNLIEVPLSPWMKSKEEKGEIVLSSRIRLARNLKDNIFPNRAGSKSLIEVIQKTEKLKDILSQKDDKEYGFFLLSDLNTLEKNILAEKHITSVQHIKDSNNRALLISEDAEVSIMINEEDHLRIQITKPGLNLWSALEKASFIDNILTDNLNIAFDERLGFLTSCPTNLGTGLRASVMLHLPALCLTGQINKIISISTKLSLTVRGLYGEGTEAFGNIFQISNQITLGQNENEIINNLILVTEQIIQREEAACVFLGQEKSSQLSDRIWRSLGVLLYARSISGRESLAKLSDVKLGVDMGLINDLEPDFFNNLLIATQDNVLRYTFKNEHLTEEQLNIFRADTIRERLNKYYRR
ncbi:protein arginine kinase [Selenomonadales bacterium OttesenSCG-928-I06]|nr:protein arginine kinase [Selenomonadales bacterium OttesenSCG-928-I06]